MFPQVTVVRCCDTQIHFHDQALVVAKVFTLLETPNTYFTPKILLEPRCFGLPIVL